MPEKPPKLLRVSEILSGDRRRHPRPASSSPCRRTFLPLCRQRRRKHLRILPRAASEPILLPFPANDDGEMEGDGSFSSSMRLPRLHTCMDLMSPSKWSRSSGILIDSMEKMKVVVSVAVEGSPGPVRAMVPLGASVEEVIATVIGKYSCEGRSPRLNMEAASSFELHHSHFTLQSLKKSEKIGEVGGRSFYLRTNNSIHGQNSGKEKVDNAFCPQLTNQMGRFAEENQNSSVINSSSSSSSLTFFTVVAIKLNTIERRTKRICKLLICFLCV